jgi:N-dimethylarginine dimethylaminohydrolase
VFILVTAELRPMHSAEASVVDTPAEIDFTTADLPARGGHGTVLLVEPSFFEVRYHINPHMGGRVDPDRRDRQWRALREAFETHTDDVVVLDPAAVAGKRGPNATPPADLPDLVYCANHGLPTPDGTGVVPATMATAERAGEPAYFEAWAGEQGYEVLEPVDAERFEGMGDTLWHPGRRLLWGGHGFRTDRAVYDELAERLDIRVVALELTDERYYHLDLCLAPLDAETVLVAPEALTDRGLATVERVFDRVVEAPAEEAREGLACNCRRLADGTVLIGDGNPETERRLNEAGYSTHAVEVGEFLKGGGSVFCLSLALGTLR